MSAGAAIERAGVTAETGGIESALVSFVHDLDLADIPAKTLNRAKIVVLDTWGAMLSARGHESVMPVIDMAKGWSGPFRGSSFGLAAPLLAQHAALVNGTMARALELDEVHEPAMLHSAATIVPAALAAAQIVGNISGKTFLEAIIAGIDVSARLSLATMPKTPRTAPRTMSLTYQTGILAGALTAARIAGLSQSEMRNVLGVAYSQCAGNQQALYEGADTVRVQQGLGAMTAIVSLELAIAGVLGVKDPLSGQSGFFPAFHGNHCNMEVLLGDLGKRFEIDNLSIKPFPCCKYTHTAIAAAQAARADARFDLDRIERVIAHVNSHECFQIVCEPQDFRALRAGLAGENGRVRAQFSLVHMVATSLRYGTVEVQHLDPDARMDPETLQLTEKTTAVIDPDYRSGEKPQALPVPGDIEVFLIGEDAPIRGTCSAPPGHPDNPMTLDDISRKYSRVPEFSTPVLGDRTLPQAVMAIDGLGAIGPLITALRAPA